MMTVTSETTTAVDAAVDARDLAAAAKYVGKVVPKRPPLPILGAAVVDATDGQMSFTATDYEKWAFQHVAADVANPGRVAVDARKLQQATGQLTGRVRLTVDDRNLTVTDGSVTYRLALLPAGDYPTAPPLGDRFAAVPGSVLHDMLRITRATAADDTLPMLGAMLLADDQGLTGVCTDRYRIGVYRTGIPYARRLKGNVLIPVPAFKQAATEFRSVSEVVLRFDVGGSYVHPRVTFDTGDRQLTVVGFDDQFPSFRKLRPKEGDFNARLEVPSKALLTGVAQITPVLDSNVPMRLDVDRSGVTLSGGDPAAEASAERHVAGVGDPFTVAFNPRFLADAARMVGGDTTRLRFTQPDTPAVVSSPDDPRVECLLMPVKLAG